MRLTNVLSYLIIIINLFALNYRQLSGGVMEKSNSAMRHIVYALPK